MTAKQHKRQERERQERQADLHEARARVRDAIIMALRLEGTLANALMGAASTGYPMNTAVNVAVTELDLVFAQLVQAQRLLQGGR